LDDVCAVEAEITTEGDAVYFFRNTSDDAGEAGRGVLRALARGDSPDRINQSGVGSNGAC
jgi:hypothetical protein